VLFECRYFVDSSPASSLEGIDEVLLSNFKIKSTVTTTEARTKPHRFSLITAIGVQYLQRDQDYGTILVEVGSYRRYDISNLRLLQFPSQLNTFDFTFEYCVGSGPSRQI
jgi:hypothetical protein